MSDVSFVPSTAGLDGEDVRTMLGKARIGELAKDSFIRFRHADGFSYARSMAFQVVFALIPAVIMVVAVAVRIGEGSFQDLLRQGITTMAPGPAGDIFLTAFEQGSDVGRANVVAIVLGGAAALVSAVAAMAQLQRGASRIYGILEDRPTVQRYALATGLTLTVGLALTVAFVLIVIGTGVGDAFADTIAETWSWVRWPLGLTVLMVGLAGLFKAAPNRKQPGMGWLLLGGAVASVGWLLVSIGLAVYLNASRAFGETYGPLAGFIGLMLWAQLSAIAVFYGLAVSAQLEAVRAGVRGPLASDVG
jgi:YihY family inner membrane protein